MQEEFEDAKWRNPQIEGQTTQWQKGKWDKTTNNDLQNITQINTISNTDICERLNVQNMKHTENKSKVRNYKEHTKHRL